MAVKHNKTKRVMVRFSPEEWELLGELAESMGLPISTYVRSKMIQHINQMKQEQYPPDHRAWPAEKKGGERCR